MAIFLGFIMVGAIIGLLLKRGEPGEPQSKVKFFSLAAVAVICAITMLMIRGGGFVFTIFLYFIKILISLCERCLHLS